MTRQVDIKLAGAYNSQELMGLNISLRKKVQESLIERVVIKSGENCGESPSSSQWLQRQDKDQYVTKRDNDGYPSRAAYKLIEIQDKHKVIRDGSKVLDLGCSPGSWLMVSKNLSSSARVVGFEY